MYVNEDIPSRLLKSHGTPDDIEILCVEINLKIKMGGFRNLSPS